jgi:hypothetical protein
VRNGVKERLKVRHQRVWERTTGAGEATAVELLYLAAQTMAMEQDRARAQLQKDAQRRTASYSRSLRGDGVCCGAAVLVVREVVARWIFHWYACPSTHNNRSQQILGWLRLLLALHRCCMRYYEGCICLCCITLSSPAAQFPLGTRTKFHARHPLTTPLVNLISSSSQSPPQPSFARLSHWPHRLIRNVRTAANLFTSTQHHLSNRLPIKGALLGEQPFVCTLRVTSFDASDGLAH